ncbi:FCD domain-containing protein [Ancylobacter sp. 6x-1]|uniref:Pyruvate dehydrogenase complex repressor n=1 Tax=Ancylobacter crimeensis TaxID=2579147 RepID=A0ABT0D8S9_9HYPH|nr:FCD domain-containing protein [Ancylobacter crimeensis]MCK0196365.1 FCD domain-containing protein [Ancylobacter crimeensis]
MIEPLRTRKLAETIADHIERMILEGVLHPGERLASERDLAAKLEVSRPSLRDALQLLEAKRLLVTSREGTRVAEFLAPLTEPLAGLLQSHDQVAADYFEYRGAVEGKAAALAAERATEPERAAIAACLAEMETAHAAGDTDREAEADLQLHRLVYEASHNLVILHVMRAFSEMLRRDIFFSRRKLFAHADIHDALLAQHLAFGTAIIEGRAGDADAAITEHLRYTGEAVEALRRDEARIGVAVRRLNRSTLIGD